MNSNEKNGEPSAGLWGGRFTSRAADSVFALSRSVHFDWRLAPYDLVSSRAHVASLKDSEIISNEVAVQLDNALTELISEVASGEFQPLPTDEDVHSALERGLKEKLGDIGGAIRAGRSRNDQVATDLKLYLIDQMLEIAHQLTSLVLPLTELQFRLCLRCAGLLDRLTRSRVLRLSRLEKVKDVLRTRCRP